MNTDVASGISSHRIKPIETKYKGYRFRSRLEARWAVFFDALGISWEVGRAVTAARSARFEHGEKP